MSAICQWLHEKLEALPLVRYPFNLKELPENGIYFLYEAGQFWGHGGQINRVVRIGTHRDGNFQNRIKDHYLAGDQFMDLNRNKPKPADRSILRKNIGRAVLNREKDEYLSVWQIDYTSRKAREAYSHLRDLDKERKIEDIITQIIRNDFFFRYILVESQEERMGSTGLESSLIGSVAGCQQCRPSAIWLGNFSPDRRIRESGLWQVQHLRAREMNDQEKSIFFESIKITRE